MLLFFIQYLHYSGMRKAQASCLTIWTIKTSSNLPPLTPAQCSQDNPIRILPIHQAAATCT